MITDACAAPPIRPAPAQSPESTVAPETALQGVYVMTISKEDLSANKDVPADLICENAGVFTYTLSTGRWNLLQTAAPGCAPVNTTINGDWKLSGDQMVFHGDEELGCDKDYVYGWKSDGTTLIYTVVKDSCAPRVVIFTTRPWIKQK
jgi:hypothetical protein